MWFFVIIVVLVVALQIFLPKNYHWPSFDRAMAKVPGPPTYPYFGTRAVVRANNDDFMSLLLKLVNQYEPLTRIEILGNYITIVSNVDDAEVIMGGKAHISKSTDYLLIEPWLGKGLLTSTGSQWFSQRKMLTPAFHFGIIEQYIDIFARNAKVFVNQIATYGEQPIEINPLVSLCTLDIVCETAMGIYVDAQHGGEKDYVKAVLEMSQLFQIRQLHPYMYRPFIFNLLPTGRWQKRVLNTLHSFTDKVINEKTELFLKKKKEGNIKAKIDDFGVKKKTAFLDLLIEMSVEKQMLTREEIRQQVDTFMFEGHDTTSAGISWALFELGLNPDVQAQAHQELDDIFGDSDRPVTNSDLTEMKYLERVLKETLRLYPSVPIIGRGIEEDVTLSGYKIPAGSNVAIFIYYIHRDPKLYPNPDKFDPDRFLPERISTRHPYSYIPFSAGPRNCIGQKFALMEEKVVLSEILRRYTIQNVTTEDEIKLMAELVLRPKENIKLIFTPRNR